MPFRALVRGAFLALSLTFCGQAAATGIVPLAGTQQFDKDSSPPAYLTGGTVNVYLAGTTTPASIYSDFALTTPLANPFTLNTAGRFPAVYVADGSYRVRVSSSVGVLQFDDDNLAAVTAAISTTPIVVTPDQLWSFADVKVRFDDQPVSGYVRCNGRTVGSATSGASERANSDTQSLFTFLWSFANVSVVTGKGVSAAADWSANKQLTLPDCAGRLIAGRDDLGNGAQGRLTSATVTGPTLVGAVGGAEVVTLTTPNLPAYTPAGSVAVAAHTHLIANVDNGTNPTQLLAGSSLMSGGGSGINYSGVPAFGYLLGGTATTPTVGLTSSATPSAPFTGTAQGGTSTAVNKLSPVILFTIYLKL